MFRFHERRTLHNKPYIYTFGWTEIPKSYASQYTCLFITSLIRLIVEKIKPLFVNFTLSYGSYLESFSQKNHFQSWNLWKKKMKILQKILSFSIVISRITIRRNFTLRQSVTRIHLNSWRNWRSFEVSFRWKFQLLTTCTDVSRKFLQITPMNNNSKKIYIYFTYIEAYLEQI